MRITGDDLPYVEGKGKGMAFALRAWRAEDKATTAGRVGELFACVGRGARPGGRWREAVHLHACLLAVLADGVSEC
jgi:hypothetical protein